MASSIISIDRNSSLAGVAEFGSKAGIFLLRYGLVLTLGWIGAVKFLPYEAQGIQGLISNSPFMSWMYKFLSVQGVSNVIGGTELMIATLLASRPFAPKLSALGSLLAAGTFITTLSFLFTTPGMFDAQYGFPAISAGGFLLKDVILLGAAVFTGAEALAGSKTGK